MARDKIKISDDISVDLPKLVESRLLVQANSGGGKSWAIRRIIEQSFGRVQIIVIDPEGEFSNLRKKYDFIYAGKGGDAPAEPRSAAMLAKKLLELKASAIIDLYELVPAERKRFVQIFFEAMVNAPKELWNDCFVILDEAHVFAPEKSDSVALGAVIDMASRGRKRGFCLIPATQRPAKLNKDVAAECNNKLIGRASLDIDRIRSAAELGFTSKEEVLSLRNLEPGEFYVFGPAISRDVVKTTIGSVEIKPPVRGRKNVTPPPPAAVKKLLGQLADLPKEAEEELRTTKEFKEKIRTLEQQLRMQKPAEPVAMGVSQWMNYGAKYGYDKFFEDKIGKSFAKQFEEERAKYRYVLTKNASTFKKIAELTSRPDVLEMTKLEVQAPPIPLPTFKQLDVKITTSPESPVFERPPAEVSTDGQVGKGEISVLTAAAQLEYGATREQLTVMSGYKKSTRNRYIQTLTALGYVELAGERVKATQAGIDFLGPAYTPLPTGPELQDHLMRTLPKGEKDILKVLLDAQGDAVERETLTNVTGYQKSTRNRYLQSLAARELVTYEGTAVRASSNLF